MYSFEEVWCPSYPSSFPLCAVFPGSSHGFALGDSRRSRRANTMFLIVYSVSLVAVRIFRSKYISRSGAAHMCTLQTSVFIRWIGPWGSRVQRKKERPQQEGLIRAGLARPPEQPQNTSMSISIQQHLLPRIAIRACPWHILTRPGSLCAGRSYALRLPIRSIDPILIAVALTCALRSPRHDPYATVRLARSSL